MPIATDIKTDNWNLCIKELTTDGWEMTFKYDEFDAGIDFDFIRLEKRNEKILLGWDNWVEGEIKAQEKHFDYLTGKTGIEFNFGKPVNLKASIIAMYDRPSAR